MAGGARIQVTCLLANGSVNSHRVTAFFSELDEHGIINACRSRCCSGEDDTSSYEGA